MESTPEEFAALEAGTAHLSEELCAYFSLMDRFGSRPAETYGDPDRLERPVEVASASFRLRSCLCRQFVRYTLRHRINQRELAQQLGIDEARVSEIMCYRIAKLKTDRLLEYLDRLEPITEIRISLGRTGGDPGDSLALVSLR